MPVIKECHADITKALITGKATLTKSKLESVRNSTWPRNNSIFSFYVRIIIIRKHYYIYIQINLNSFVNNALSL